MSIATSINLGGNMAMELANIRQNAIDLRSTLNSISNMNVNVSTYRMRENLQSLNRETQTTQKNINDAFKMNAQVTGIQGVINGFRQVRTSITDIITEMKSFNSEIRQARSGITGIALRSAAASVRSMDNSMIKVNSSIQRNINAQLRHNDAISAGNSRLSEMSERIAAIAAAYLGIEAMKKLITQSDEMTQFAGRSQFVVEQGKNLQDFRNQVMQLANDTRAQFSDVAGFVSKLGTNAGNAFKGSDELVNFVKQINQLTLLSGASISEMRSVMTQLPQALASGNLQGDELRSIRENAPLVNQAIQEYAHQVLGLDGTTKQLGKDGKLTSRVIVDAMQWASSRTDEMMANTPFTFGQRWNLAINSFTEKMQDFYLMMSRISNNSKIQNVFNDIAQAAADTAVSLGMVMGAGLSFAGWLSSMGILTPILRDGALAIGALAMGTLTYRIAMYALAPPIIAVKDAYLAYAAAQSISNGQTFLGAVLTGVLTSAQITAAVATGNLTYAMVLLDAAMAANPIGLIVGGILLFIGVLALGVAAVNHFAGTNISVVGLIAGLFGWLAMNIVNSFIFVTNMVKAVANFLANAFTHPLQATKNLFAEIWGGIVELVGTNVNRIIGLINKIPGMNVGYANWASWKRFAPEANYSSDMTNFKPTDYVSGWDIDSYNWGANLLSNLKNAVTPDLGGLPPTEGQGGSYGDGSDMPGDVKAIRKHTHKLADSAEDLTKLRELVEQQIINRYTMLNIEFGDTNVNGSMLDKHQLALEAANAAYDKVYKEIAQVNEIGTE